jgi:hypothetical protein
VVLLQCCEESRSSLLPESELKSPGAREGVKSATYSMHTEYRGHGLRKMCFIMSEELRGAGYLSAG